MSPDQSEITSKESISRQLAYTAEFKSFVGDHPGTLTKVRVMIKALLHDKKGARAEESGIVVEKVQPSPYFKVTLADKSFFVKVRRHIMTGENLEEFRALARLKEMYKDNPKVEVVNFQLAFTSWNENYFVAEWDDRFVKNLAVGLEQRIQTGIAVQTADNTALQKHVKDLGSRVNEIARQLEQAGFYDYGPVNMAYDPQTDTIILFDILFHRQNQSE